MLLGLSESLPRLVETKYRAAKATHSLIFSSTELAIIRTSAGIPVSSSACLIYLLLLIVLMQPQFQLRYCPALAKKPVVASKDNPPETKRRDVFENPSADLLIADIPSTNPSHILVLNKYPVIKEHFIIATKTNKQQTHVLEEDDLEATYACLKAWREAHGPQKRLFAFFNSGEHSGASQPHRHLQFLPVDSMRDGEQSNGWELLIDLILADKPRPSGLLQHSAVPFAHFAFHFPPEPTGPQLHKIYTDLYQLAKTAVDDFISSNPNSFTLHATDEGASPISYNLAMTTTGMAICPRRSEGSMLRRDEGSDIGFVALNGTVLGGTLMVKYQEEWDVLRSQPEKLDSILESIGIPTIKQTHNL